jgi:glycogen phosphorylase
MDQNIAYFSMEIGFDPLIPTYSGGLGILAGDTLKAAADLKLPLVGVTLISSKGYFTQALKPEDGSQVESTTPWNPKEKCKLLPVQVSVAIEGRNVLVQAWEYTITGITGFTVPVLLLDTNVAGNSTEDMSITDTLYGGDQRYRLMQETVLGIGGVRILKALGANINRYHMNEGHAALLALELFKEHALATNCSLDNFDACRTSSMDIVRKLCAFTTHTPVAAGHDRFPYALVQKVLGDFLPLDMIQRLGGNEELNMTLLALNLSHYVNSVAKKHQDVSQHLFPGYHFSFITNGVHSATWTGPAMAALFDKKLSGWRYDSFELRHAISIPKEELWEAHMQAKGTLIDFINYHFNAGLDKNVFTIGFARRATAYKRAELIFYDIKRLKAIGKERKIQIVLAGKAHPHDTEGKELIQKLRWHAGEVSDVIKVVYLPNYDMPLAQMLIPGVDVWLNTPQRPQEASGTSGMKAAHNGVPSVSVLDGWWIEGHNEGVTGWSIGPAPTEENEHINDDAADAAELYEKLEKVIMPMFYDDRDKFVQVMRNSIAFNASFFNTHRMVQQYALKAYLR